MLPEVATIHSLSWFWVIDSTYTCIWLFYQLIYPFQWFCNPLMLKIHHFGAIRCDLGTSRAPKLLTDAERRHFQKFPYPIKKTVTNMFLVVVDIIFHTDHRKNVWNFFSSHNMFSQEVKVGQVKSNQTCYSEWSTLQICWTGFLMFSPGRQFLSNTIYFSDHFATLRCQKFLFFHFFLVIQSLYPKRVPEGHRDHCT